MNEQHPCSDRESIIDLINRYAIALDTKDWYSLRTCFLADATCEYEGFGEYRGIDAIEMICQQTISPLTASQHLLGNHGVTTRGDEADAVCYVQAQHIRTGSTGGEVFTLGGKYTDLVVRTDDGWQIAHRTLTTLWTTGNPSVLGEAFLADPSES